MSTKMNQKKILPVLTLVMMGTLTVLLGCDHRPVQMINDIDPFYLDPYRPQMHYSRDTAWLSDPNGLFYNDGVWHLMFQGMSNRVAWAKVGTNWEHATSTDLLHWKNEPTVLQGDSLIANWSGGAVVDKGKVWAYYTNHFMDIYPETPNRNRICIATSEDNGKTWTYNKDRIAVENKQFPSERDPSVFWHEPSKKWVMATAGTGHIRFYSSTNLTDWKFESETLPYPSWECPSLATMKVEETGEEKVLLITSTNGGVANSSHGTCYHVGTFDGHEFHPEDTSKTKHWMDWGSDFYAGLVFANAPQNRVLFQSWFGWPCQINTELCRTSKFNGTMNLIRELSLHVDKQGKYYVTSNPIDEYKQLRTDSVLFRSIALLGRKVIKEHVGSHEPLEIELDVTLDKGSLFGIRLKNDFGEDYVFQYDDWHHHFLGDRTNAGTVPGHLGNGYNRISRMPYIAKDSHLKLRIYWDVSTFEVFIDGGREAFSQLLYPRESFSKIELFSFAGTTQVNEMRIYNLESIWKKN